MKNVFIQYCCPQHLLSRITGWLAECRWRWFKNWAIRRLIRTQQVNVSEALNEDVDHYPTFNSFFTRRLKPELRPIVSGNLIASPVDGCVSQIGRIENETLFQAKKFHFSVASLLGGTTELAKEFHQGYFATLYLAPRDYHRVHMPIDGTLRTSIYIPGQLFSVNQYTANGVPNLYARNERLVSIFDTGAGPMAVILVGAMLVGSIQTEWGHAPTRHLSTQSHFGDIKLARGADLGHFKMGSTVILLFAKDAIEWSSELQAGSMVKMGQAMGEMKG